MLKYLLQCPECGSKREYTPRFGKLPKPKSTVICFDCRIEIRVRENIVEKLEE